MLHLLKFALCLSLCLAAGNSWAAQSPGQEVAQAALSQIGVTTVYDPSYVRLDYPNGDVPLERGVCSDVVIRALRKVGMDLQQLIHQDMRVNFKQYPQNWGLKATDRNIDHRRVPNIVAYFKRQGRSLPLPVQNQHLQPGDLIAWMLPANLPHIGVVSRVHNGQVWLVHNIGSGAREEQVLDCWPITAHLRPVD